MPAPLAVWLGTSPAGMLAAGRRLGQLRFTRSPASPLLTVASGGDDEQWSAPFARAWFENLLPEEDRRTAVEAEHNVDRGDTFALLAAIGWECAGAVSVLPDDREPASGTYQPLTDEDVHERLDALPNRIADIDDRVRTSLGGAQEKLLLARRDGQWQLPLDGAISTHILKPEPDRFPGLAIAEAWALAAASAVTRTSSAELLAPTGHRPTLVVERYDRAVDDGRIARSHQEDLCQLLGLLPSEKYARSDGAGNASVLRLAEILVARASDPPFELRRLLEHVTVTVALANTDAHAKNLSVVHVGSGTVVLAPVYDVSPTLFFLPNTKRMALSVGRKWRIDEIERKHLLVEARSWGMPDQLVRETVTSTLQRFDSGMTTADAKYPDLPAGLRNVVRVQFERLARSDF